MMKKSQGCRVAGLLGWPGRDYRGSLHGPATAQRAEQRSNQSTQQLLLEKRSNPATRQLLFQQLLLALLTVLALNRCGYALVGHSNFLDPKVRTVQVPAFVNRTTRVELEQRVTQAGAEEMVARGRLKLVTAPSEADVILRGSIDSFGLFAIAYNAQG